MPASPVPWAHQALQDFPGGRVVRETWGPPDGLEKKVTQALLVLKDPQGHQENLVPQDDPATKEKRVTRLYQELKGAKEKEVLMAPKDFQGSQDKMVGMDMLEKQGIQDCQGIMKTQSQVIEDFLDRQAPLAEKDPRGLQDWDFLAHWDKGGLQDLRAAQERGALMA